MNPDRVEAPSDEDIAALRGQVEGLKEAIEEHEASEARVAGVPPQPPRKAVQTARKANARKLKRSLVRQQRRRNR